MDISELNISTSTIPITVDAVKNLQNYQMTRCTYFSISNTAPLSEWKVNSENISVPFFMLGLSGVITSPPGGDLLFDTPSKLDSLFEAIEQNDRFFVELDDIWLPNKLFYRTNSETQRSQVYRVGYDLFTLAYTLRDEVNTHEEFLNRMSQSDIPVMLEYSKTETTCLNDWNNEQIEINRKLYHENPETKLSRKGE
jgi:hypothetical protein